MAASEQELVATLCAVDVAAEPVDPDVWPVLADPDAREEIDRRLRAVGRQLLTVRAAGSVDRAVVGYLTGWDDTVADAMLAAGMNPLSRIERAVLALALLHSVAIPQASGLVPPRGLREAASFDRALLWERPHANEHSLGKTVVGQAVKVLVARGLLTPQLRPGPVFDHLSQAATERIWRNLLVLARPSWARYLPPLVAPDPAEENRNLSGESS